MRARDVYCTRRGRPASRHIALTAASSPHANPRAVAAAGMSAKDPADFDPFPPNHYTAPLLRWLQRVEERMREGERVSPPSRRGRPKALATQPTTSKQRHLGQVLKLIAEVSVQHLNYCTIKPIAGELVKLGHYSTDRTARRDVAEALAWIVKMIEPIEPERSSRNVTSVRVVIAVSSVLSAMFPVRE
jgi:hypothetical protein